MATGSVKKQGSIVVKDALAPKRPESLVGSGFQRFSTTWSCLQNPDSLTRKPFAGPSALGDLSSSWQLVYRIRVHACKGSIRALQSKNPGVRRDFPLIAVRR